MELGNEQLERYARHIVLPNVGELGQKKLLNSRVLVIGAGGLGSPSLMYLAAAGVGTIGIADADCVDVSNLQRQIIHTEKKVGIPKAKSAEEAVTAINSDATVNTYNFFVTADNIDGLIRDYDFVLDCTDNFDAKFLINDACVAAGKPFSHAGVFRFGGQLMTYVPGEGPCYRCIFNSPPPPDAVVSGRQAGIVGAVPGTIGTLQAMEAIKYLLGLGGLLTGQLLTYDALKMEFRKIEFSKNADCPSCGKSDKR